MKINTKKGFSLIELSIVLIIIGLLVAGITGGASLIKSAELRSTMSEIRNYQTAVNAYYTAVGELPGSNGSSQISFGFSSYAFYQMASEAIIDNATSDFSSDSAAAVTSLDSTNSPASRYKGAFYALGYNNQMRQNVIFMFASSESAGTLGTANNGSSSVNTTNASMTEKDARFIDEKMDNGIIDSGKIYGFSKTSTTCVYSTTSTERNCSIAIGIGL